MQMLTLLNVKY